MNIFPLTALGTLLFATLPIAAVATEFVLRVTGQESLPPKWIQQDGRASTGVCPDILAAISRVEPRLRFTGLDDIRSVLVIEQNLRLGNAEIACALVSTPLRRHIAIAIPQPLYVSRQRLAAAADDTAEINSLDDLARLKPLVTTSRGAAYIDQLRALGITVDDSTGSNVTNLRKILAGHGRYFYMNELTLHWLIREQKLQDRIKLMPAVLKEDSMFLWLSKKAPPQAAPLLAAAVKKLSDSGELARIYARWSDESGVGPRND
ncbi:substrate-binding periplasmic protein [Pseudoduganella sp. R-31]|uniref:substrate-binding periplasmic protein n=1 Tax=unclassified Pseudoduganella TaxID=2637179 RepID=UPI003CF77776